MRMRTLSEKSAGAGHRAVSLHRDCVLVYAPSFFHQNMSLYALDFFTIKDKGITNVQSMEVIVSNKRRQCITSNCIGRKKTSFEDMDQISYMN